MSEEQLYLVIATVIVTYVIGVIIGFLIGRDFASEPKMEVTIVNEKKCDILA